jgi:ABC-type sulfate transport system permease subunit
MMIKAFRDSLQRIQLRRNYAAFAVASLLAVLAIITLGLKTLVERQTRRQLQDIDTPSGE